MLATRKVWVIAASIAAALTMGSARLASAQGDFPIQSGNNGRTGKVSDPQTYSPGLSHVVWFWPNGATRPGTVLRDNPSNQVTKVPAASWVDPPFDQEAAYFYQATPVDGGGPIDQRVGAFPYAAGYSYARSVPSAPGSHNDPTVATLGEATFAWTLDPTLDGTTASNYQLYVWIPNGPTGPVGGPYIYPNRYYVYEILYGNGQRWIDVVDTNVAGQGWVRLGNGGSATNQVFPYTGAPIQIRLYNVEWRDVFDNLLEDTTVPRAVYADAVMAVPDNGSISAAPTVAQVATATPNQRTQVVEAFNKDSVTYSNGTQQTITTPDVEAFYHDGTGPNLNAPIWKWSPLDVSPYAVSMDDTDANWVPGQWLSENTVNHFGTDYLTSTITNTAGSAVYVTYKPTLDDGSYLIQVYCGGNLGAELFGTQTTVYVTEGANPPTAYQIDQSTPGWVTISSRRFQNLASLGQPLTVQISNYSPLAGDNGLKAYADDVKFIGAFNESILASPTQAKALITPQGGGAAVEKDVVVVAAEDGHIYCLDALGNANGTTTCYWAYPSIEPKGVSDPNQVAGEDGVGGLAEMPTDGFGQSSPIVQRINGVDYCFIAGKNGRVYCLNMAGRGDFDPATGKIGSTSRNWTYPSDYPDFKRQAISGGFGGSLTYGDTTQGPTIFVPAGEGRLYALDALGGANKSTTARWTYPAKTANTLGAITTTPTFDFGRVYFGTAKADDSLPGQFYALNADTGALVWLFEGGPNAPADNFLGGPCTATSTQLGIVNNMIFCANENLFVYGIDADTGKLLWQTNELNSGCSVPLTFADMTVYNTAGTTVPNTPVVLVPTEDGRFDGLFAREADVNVDGGKLAWEYVSGSDSITASMSNGWSFLYGADMAGNLFAWGNGGAIGGMGTPPGGESIVPNNPLSLKYRDAKVALLTRTGYINLRYSSDPAGEVGTQDYATYINNNASNPYIRTLDAFEWGETAYLLVYDFPAENPDLNSTTPPVVNFQIGVEGASVRQYGVQAKKWASGAPADKDGYAILAFPIQGSGATSIPPGNANVKFSFSVTNSSGQAQNVAVSYAKEIRIANPIGIYMPDPNTGAIGGGTRVFGVNPVTTDPQRLVNGSQNVGGVNGPLLAQSEGVVGNGSSGTGSFWVVDMSMLTLLKGPDRGLEGVRVTDPELGWVGNGDIVTNGVTNPLNPLYYPGFEDYPVNHPNTSIDYPNIGRQALAVTKDPLGTAENAIVSQSGVALAPPDPYDENAIQTRTTHPVLFSLAVNVPRYQPANNDSARYFTDSAGASLPSGYQSRIRVYVDSNGNSELDSVSGRREAFRSWVTTVAVPIDSSLQVTTPTLDLGTLPGGAGFSPAAPGTNDGLSLSPWLPVYGSLTDVTGANTVTPITTANSVYANMFKPFHAVNNGNVNLRDVRLAHGVRTDPGGSPTDGPWPIYANSVDSLGWLDTSTNVWTNFDATFGLLPEISVQKPRVGDTSPAEMLINPIRRSNQITGVLQSPLFPNGPIGEDALPKIAATPPIGFPVGLYDQRMELVDSYGFGDEWMHVDGATGEPSQTFSDPTFELKLNVRETRLTGGFTPMTAPMIDYPQPKVNAQAFTYSNLQPSAFRSPQGSLVAAWTSPEPKFNAPVPATAVTDPAYRIYLASLSGVAPQNAPSPLNDLNQFKYAAKDRWFSQSIGPYPSLPNYDGLFQSLSSETVIPGTEKFGAPAFSPNGLLDPVTGGTFNNAIMAFVGSAQKQITGAGRTVESKIMAATIQVASDGSLKASAPSAMAFDPNTPKNHPSLYQTGGGAVVFYGAGGSGQGQLFYTLFDGTAFTQPVPMSLGDGFESVSQPSVRIRNYTGGNNLLSGPLVELAFSGKLREQAASQVFYGRMSTQTVQLNGKAGYAPNSFVDLGSVTQEPLVPTNDTGVYQANGVVWDASKTINVYQALNGTIVNLDASTPSNPRVVDPQTGMIRFDTKLGGQVYIDPTLGTVRFGSTTPLKGATILLDYTPTFMKISQSDVNGSASPELLYDNRVSGDVSNYSYWFTVNSNGTLSNIGGNSAPRPGRYWFTYTRAASGAGQAARPYWKTLRPGVQLAWPIATDQSGNLLGITISGATGPVQIDPANGTIYFTAADEDRNVKINYTGLNGANVTVAGNYAGPVRLVTERSESEVPIDQPINESGMFPFLDPFEASPRRPDLVWMIYSSTRTGSPDLYLQGMAPRFTPIVGGK